MFARIRWSKLSQGATVDQALTIHRERILPSLQTQAGFLGSAVLVNRDTNEGVTATYWQTAKARAASEAIGAAGRAESARAAGVVVSEVDRFEMLLSDRAAPARVGAFTRVNDTTITPAQFDVVVGSLRDTAIPAARGLSGYISTRVWANRDSGRLIVSTSWETAADCEASEEVMGGLRRRAAEVAQAQTQPKVTLYEVAFVDTTPAMDQVSTTTAGTG